MATPHRAPLRRLLGPGQPEVARDVCFAELDRYVDLELSGADAEAAVPGMAAHLRGCPACGDEHDSLAALLAEAVGRESEPRLY